MRGLLTVQKTLEGVFGGSGLNGFGGRFADSVMIRGYRKPEGISDRVRENKYP